MEDISLHILDIAENSIRAKAKNIIIMMNEDKKNDLLTLTIEDDGEGMDNKTKEYALNPFFTTKKGKKVGLGLAFLSHSAEEAAGAMVTLTINNQKIEVEEGINLLTAIERLGIKIPTLCYHKALMPYGACRLCVVEVQVPGRASSLQASCYYPVVDGINVFTNTERIFKART